MFFLFFWPLNYIYRQIIYGYTMNKNEYILNESKIANLITQELKKSDVIDIIKKDKDFENRVKEIVRTLLKDMFRVLYQHNDILKALGR